MVIYLHHVSIDWDTSNRLLRLLVFRFPGDPMEIVTVVGRLMPHLAIPDPLAESTFPHAPYGCKMQWVKKYFILMEWTGRHSATD